MQIPNKPKPWKHLRRPAGRLYHILIHFLILSLLLPASGVQAQTPITVQARGSTAMTVETGINYDMSGRRYQMIDLGTLGGPNSTPVAINNAGQIIGKADTAALDTHAVLWQGGPPPLDLQTLGGRHSKAFAINYKGQVIGNSHVVEDGKAWCCHAFLWGAGGMIDLKTLGGKVSRPIAINGQGQVIGQSLVANDPYYYYHAVLWQASQDWLPIELGALGDAWSRPVAINEAGQVVGVSPLTPGGLSQPDHAVLWQESQNWVPIDLNPAGAQHSSALDINEAGRIVGNAGFKVQLEYQQHAVVWDFTVPTVLNNLGGRHAQAIAMNEAGQVIGNSYLKDNRTVHAFLWQGGDPIDLETLGGAQSWAVAINNKGQVIGNSTLLGNEHLQHGFLWDNGEMTNLGDLGGGTSQAIAINDKGQVIGNSTDVYGNTRAFLWEDGKIKNLDTLGGNASYAIAINEAGQVIGTSLRGNNESHAFLAIPLPNTSIYILGETEQASYDASAAAVVSYSVYVEPHQSMRKSFAGVNSGPVWFLNTYGLPMMAAERVIYKVNGVNTSFSEMMALPHSQLDYTYWLPWYNNVDLDTQLRFANPLGVPATVHVYIGGTEMAGSPFTLAGRASTRKSFPGINRGPVKIESDRPIVAAERVIYKVNGTPTSFSEMMALPASQLDTTYWLPWYNNVDLDTQLRFANPSDSPATVHVYIGGTEMPGSPFALGAGASTRKSFAGINTGPVKIESNVNIVAAERVIYRVNGVPTSFSEMMGSPASQLDSIYWLPWYNNVDLDTQLRFANVSDSPAKVHVYVGEKEMAGSPFILAAGRSTRKSFPGVNRGPVKIESNVDIIAAERVIYRVNGVPTSFSEMMGLPNSQLNTSYWLPWYNNVDLDTQLRFGIP